MAKPLVLPIWDTTVVNVTEPDATHKAQGWLAPAGVPEKPPFEYFNFWQHNVYAWIKELNDYGLVAWDAATQYEIGSLTMGSDFVLYRSLTAANINNDPVGDIVNWVDYRQFGQKRIVNEINKPYTGVATGIVLIPHDDSIPQNTEGDEYMAAAAYTPENALNILTIEIGAMISHSALNKGNTVALFQDAIVNALDAVAQSSIGGADGVEWFSFAHEVVAGSTVARTYKVRAGADTGGTTTFNGQAGARLFGGVAGSYIKITERTP